MRSPFAAMGGLLLGTTLVAGGFARAADPVALRAESFTVPPSTQPLVFVQVKNLLEVPYEGLVAMKPPEGWRIAPTRRDVMLQPGEIKRVPFTVERGRNVEANAYPIEVSAIGAGATVVRKQTVVCASAPYYKPTIDGDPSDWKDAIPVAFTSGGKRTTISTFWNRRQFSMLVAVEEDRLVRYDPQSAADGCDALQVALSPQDTQTGASPNDEARRFEFLFVATGEGTTGKCFQLAEPGMKLAEAAKSRSLGPLLYDKAEVAVRRDGHTTYYECGLSFTPMRNDIRPSEGREFCLSVLVHDRDGTGIRDWGQAAGLWPSQRNPLAWSRWEGAAWGEEPPYDNKLQWGLCTSKY